MTCPKCRRPVSAVEYEPQDGPHAGLSRYYHRDPYTLRAYICIVVEPWAPEIANQGGTDAWTPTR